MVVLAFDTTLGACSAAIGDAGRLLAGRYEPMFKGHAERLIPMIREVMADADLGFHDIDEFRVTRGPGSFTGVRVGISAARSLSLATGSPIVGLGSLEAIAHTLLQKKTQKRNILTDGPLTIAVDARRGEIYLQDFQIKRQQLSVLSPPRALSAQLAAGETGNKTRRIAGTGAALLADAAAMLGAQTEIVMRDIFPDAAALTGLNNAHFISDETAGKPLYLRAPDAKPQSGKHIVRLDSLLPDQHGPLS